MHKSVYFKALITFFGQICLWVMKFTISPMCSHFANFWRAFSFIQSFIQYFATIYSFKKVFFQKKYFVFIQRKYSFKKNQLYSFNKKMDYRPWLIYSLLNFCQYCASVPRRDRSVWRGVPTCSPLPSSHVTHRDCTHNIPDICYIFMPTYFLKFSQLHPNQSPSHSNEEHFHIPDKKIVYPYTAERRDVLGNISPGSRRTNKRFPKGQGGCISIYVHVQCTVYTERPFSVSLIFLLATDGVKYEVCTPPARTGRSMYPSRWYHLQISTWQMWKNFRFLHICHEFCDK